MEGKDEAECHLNKADSCEGASSPSANEQSTRKDLTDLYLHIPYGFQPKACYKPKSKSKEITGVTYNSRSRQFIILDSKGITAWSCNSVVNSVSRLLDYPSYQFNLIHLLLHSKKFNVYFGLSKDYALKVFNINFLEVFSVISDMNSVLCMVFNSVTDELITGGTGGVRFWSFGEIKRNEHTLIRDSRPMANYGLILRCKHPAMGGNMVKDIILDERNQRLYCLSERNVVAYDMDGKFLFQLKSAHQGVVTGCVYSKFSNFVATCATDCKVNVWSSNGGCVHSFYGHSKAVTNLLLHPEAPSLIITSSQDGTVKIFSLDIMEEIYSHTVFTEGIQWMNLISNDVLYCATSKGLQVFSINHVANFWTMIRCPLKSLSLFDSHSKTARVIAIGEDNSTRLLSKTSHLLSTVLPPPPVTTIEHKQSVRAHAYSSLYSLMYLLVNEEEIWVYYTKTNPANRVEVWQLSDVRGVNHQENRDPDRTKSCELISGGSRLGTACERAASRSPTSPSPQSTTKIVDDVPCLALAFLNSPVLLKTTQDDSYSDISYFLVAGLQDGRLLFLSPFSGLLMYFQFQATKGAVLSIQHDTTTNTFLLNTITLNEFTIQVRTLPHLELQHQVSVGKDLTCFVRMGNALLSGHETGRLHLHHLTQERFNSHEVMATTFGAQKLSKDHLDAVLSVDANNGLLLFCSSSKDGCIKIWDNAKILLREIIMDKSLTAVCFLNSSGDLLAGFRNHVFSISREKVHLSLYSGNAKSRGNSVSCGAESDVYEDPRIRFEYKKTIPPEPVRMETYLVPFANMSINLARFLSGHPPPGTLEEDLAEEFDETESELSDLFSVAPTEVYMSHDGTPLSRSRSSSIGSWDLPNLGFSPVSSPPRTPPLAMSPVLESESDDEHNTAPGDSTPVENKEPYSPSCKRFPQEYKESNRVRVMPVFSLRKRPGLSQVKIDSRAVRSKTNINGDQHARVARGGREENTNASVQAPKSFQFNRPKRAARAIVKKSKQSLERTSERIKPQRPWQQDKPQNLDSANVGRQDEMKENTTTVTDEKRVLEKSNMKENMRGHSSENARVPRGSSTITKVVKGGAKEEWNGISRSKLPDRTEIESWGLDETRESSSDNSKDEAVLAVNGFSGDPKQTEDSYVDAFDNTGTELTICNEQESILQQRQEEKGSPLFVEDDKLPSLSDITTIHLDSEQEKQDKPVLQTGSVEEEQDGPVLKTGSVEEEQDGPTSKTDSVQEERDKPVSITDSVEEEQDKPVSKTGLFVVSENLEDAGKVSRKSLSISRPHRVPHKSGRRSVSPIHPSPKVVSVLDSACVGDQGGQRLHPSSALKIYALAKTRRQSSTNGMSLVSKPRVKQRSFVKHYTSEVAFGVEHARGMTDEELKRIIRRRGDAQGSQSNIETVKESEKTVRAKESERMETAKEKRHPREKKELVNWCMNALTEKVKYPVFAPRPRLRSRRSMKAEESKAKTDTEIVAARGNYSCDQCETAQYDRDQEYKDLEAWKLERTSTTRKQEAWFENGAINSRGLLALKKEHVKEMSRSAPTVYSEGWQERFLEKTKSLKEKRFERQRNVSERRRADEEILEEKRTNILGSQGCGEMELDIGFAEVNSRMPQQEDVSKNGRSSFEDFKNNPVIAQPYRLGKFNSNKDQSWLSALGVTPECQYTADSILELIPRPKSAPSIPSKCRKYILVATESANIRNKPELTPLEETLIFKRFPKSKLKPRTRSPQAPELLRPRSVAKMQTVHISCE